MHRRSWRRVITNRERKVKGERMNELPKNPYMMVSAVNMLLRDGEFESLEELCASFDREPEEMTAFLRESGYEHNTEQKQFR